MPTKKYTIEGKLQWAKVFPENREMKDWQGNAHAFGGLYKIDMILDKDNKAIYKSSGTSGKGKFDDDGNFIVTLKRKHEDKFEWAGGAPTVYKPDGSQWDFASDGVIPNGSEGKAVFSVYTTSMSPGTRLEAVHVTKVAELEKKPEVVEPKSTPKVKAKYDEEIPF